MTKRFGCRISERPSTHGFAIWRYEFPGGLAPPQQSVDDVCRQVPKLSGPVSYLLGLFIASLEAELRSGYSHWSIREVNPVLETRGDTFVLLAVEVTCTLHREDALRALNMTIVKQTAAWAGVSLDPVELLHLTAPRLPQ